MAADRQAVEQTALQFGQTSQDALTAIGQAQSTAVGAVKAEGNKQTTAVQEAGTQAVSEVTEAKTTAVQSPRRAIRRPKGLRMRLPGLWRIGSRSARIRLI